MLVYVNMPWLPLLKNYIGVVWAGAPGLSLVSDHSPQVAFGSHSSDKMVLGRWNQGIFRIFFQRGSMYHENQNTCWDLGLLVWWFFTFSRWWFQRCFYFHPYLGKWSNLTIFFQMGWNHQLVILYFLTRYITIIHHHFGRICFDLFRFASNMQI